MGVHEGELLGDGVVFRTDGAAGDGGGRGVIFTGEDYQALLVGGGGEGADVGDGSAGAEDWEVRGMSVRVIF